MVYFNELEMKALISVYNKDIVVEFARALNELGLEIIATEGTARLILDNGIPVTKVSAFTGVQEMLGGKLKTLHPTIHAAIATGAIEIVTVNLIPLDSSSKNTLDNMDLGGVAMLRSGIKNFEHVAVIVNPARYTGIIDELRVSGQIARGTRLRLAQEASKYIVAYELKINELLERLE